MAHLKGGVSRCGTSCRQRRTARRLGTNHHRLRSAAPPDGRRRPAASSTRQSGSPQPLIHHCVHRCFSLQHDNTPTLSTISLPQDKFQRCLFLRAVSEYFNDPPEFPPRPNALPMAWFFAVNCLILPLPMLLAHLQSCSLLASARHKCLITAPDCAAQRASNAPSSAG